MCLSRSRAICYLLRKCLRTCFLAQHSSVVTVGLLVQEREERHIAEKAVLEEKIQAYREQVEQMADLQSRNLRLQNQLADTNSSVERVDRLQKEVLFH